MIISSTTSLFLSFIGWAILPDVFTTYLLKGIYWLSAFSSALPKQFPFLPSFPPPVRGTPLYARHYRLVYAFVVLSYLSYNLIQSSLIMELNYYEMLGVQTDVDDSGLKLAFRAWVRMNHPDKIQGRGDELQREEWFKRVRSGYEALRDPVVRFAYDRFGSDVLTWTECTTMREYLRYGLMQSSGYHIVTFSALIGFGAVGKASSITFWRYLLYFFVLTYELWLILSPAPSILSFIFPQRVAYQHILLFHHIFLFSSVALSRVAPVLFPDADSNRRADGKRLAGAVESVRKMVHVVEGEVNSLLNIEMSTLSAPRPLAPLQLTSSSSIASSISMPPPFTALPPAPPPSNETMVVLKKEMEDMIIEGTIRQEAVFGVGRGAGLKGAVENVLLRNRHLNIGEPLSRSKSMYGDLGLKSLPLPVSPVETKLELPPSPRLSPPPRPQSVRRGSSYVRARSVSMVI